MDKDIKKKLPVHELTISDDKKTGVNCISFVNKMKRPNIEDTRIKGGMSIAGNSVNVYVYSRMQDKYIDYLLKSLKKIAKKEGKMGLRIKELEREIARRVRSYNKSIKNTRGYWGVYT